MAAPKKKTSPKKKNADDDENAADDEENVPVPLVRTTRDVHSAISEKQRIRTTERRREVFRDS